MSSGIFSESSTRAFLAFAGRVVPDEGPQAPGANSEATLRKAAGFLASQDRATQGKVRMLLEALEWLAVFRYRKRFTRLSMAKQDAYLRAWESSPIQLFRFGFSSLRNLVLVSFYTQAQAWPRIGYPGPVLETKKT